LEPGVNIENVPPVGTVQTVSVGTQIHQYNRTYTFDAVVPQERMKIAPLLIPLIVESGTPMFQVDTKVKLKACIQGGACGLDDDGDGTFDRMAKDDIASAFKLKKKVAYRKERMTVDNPDSLKQVILYSGATVDTLRLSYREFSNNMARPAFTEELIIPITAKFPQDVAVKAVKFRIHSIDGLGMKYEILP
jgi:hypothetical protein